MLRDATLAPLPNPSSVLLPPLALAVRLDTPVFVLLFLCNAAMRSDREDAPVGRFVGRRGDCSDLQNLERQSYQSSIMRVVSAPHTYIVEYTIAIRKAR